MNKLHLNLVLFFVTMLAFSACQKDKSEYVTKPVSKTINLLSDHTWKLMDYRTKVAGASAWSRDWVSYEPCLKDDKLKYQNVSSFQIDDFNTRCTPNAPRLRYEGIWNLSKDEKTVSHVTTYGAAWNYNIVTLDENKLVYVEKIGGNEVEYTYGRDLPASEVALLLADSNWTLSNYRTQVMGGSWVNEFATYPACLKDDRLRFFTDGIYWVDDYNTQCNVADPKYKLKAYWDLNATKTVMTLSLANGTTSTRDVTALGMNNLVLVENTPTGKREYSYIR
jgi:hypothetical protein